MKEVFDIASCIPQRPPFVFIDAIETVNETTARTNYTVTKDCPLVTGDVLPLSGLLENMAQTCAVQMGHMEGGNRIGYIGAVKEMETHLLPGIGKTIATEVRLVQRVFNICLMECTAFMDNEVIATATLKLASAE